MQPGTLWALTLWVARGAERRRITLLFIAGWLRIFGVLGTPLTALLVTRSTAQLVRFAISLAPLQSVATKYGGAAKNAAPAQACRLSL